MSVLIVIGYELPFRAEEISLKVLKMQRDFLIDLEDAVVAVKDKNDKVKLNQIHKLTQSVAPSFFVGLPYCGATRELYEDSYSCGFV